MSIKINTLQVENVKRVKAVALEPSANGLTVIGGKNGQGKTSVLDAIAWALGGDRYRPSNAERGGLGAEGLARGEHGAQATAAGVIHGACLPSAACARGR